MSITPILQMQRNQISDRVSNLIKMEELDWTCFSGLPWKPGCWLEGHLYGENLVWAPDRWTKAHSRQSQVWWLFVNTKQKQEERAPFPC